MLAVALDRQRCGGDRLHGAERIAFDAGHLHQPGDRIAGHAEMVFQRDFGGVLDLLGRAAHHGGKAGGRHGGGRAHLALTADLGAGDRGVRLDDAADCRRGQQEVANAVLVGIVMEMQLVAQDGRHDAGRAVGRRRHDAAARRILLVHRHGIDGEPVIGEQRIGPVLTPFLLQACRAAFWRGAAP